MKDNIKNIFRPLKNYAHAFLLFGYDFFRFIGNSNVSGKNEKKAHQYRVMKIYHSLEKSISFRVQRPGSGTGVARLLREILDQKTATNDIYNLAARNVLECFGGDAHSENLVGGAFEYSSKELNKGVLDSPEDFFLTRYTAREFSATPVKHDLIERAVSLAIKSPSACNRQPWHVYSTQKTGLIEEALTIQNGAGGFVNEVGCLLVLCVDLRAYDTSVERYQGYIDGGMFSMSLVSALHSLGLASCCLNWSKGVSDDRMLRNALGLEKEHNILMLLAVGHPKAEFKVCKSDRDHAEKYITHL